MNPSLRKKIQQTLTSSMNDDTFKNLAGLVIQEKLDTTDIETHLRIVKDEIERYNKNKKLPQNKQMMDKFQDTLADIITDSIVKRMK
jgi:hypothetical protein